MRRPRSRLLALAAVALLAACGGPLLFVEVVIPELTITLPQQDIPAFTGLPDQASNCGDGCVFTEQSYDFGDSVPFLGEDHVDVDLRLTAMDLTLDAGVSDLGTVSAVTVKVLDPDDPTQFVVVASYLRPQDPAAPITGFAVSGNANLDIGGYLTGSKFVTRAEMHYDAPTPAFTATITATFSLVVKVDYGAYVF